MPGPSSTHSFSKFGNNKFNKRGVLHTGAQHSAPSSNAGSNTSTSYGNYRGGYRPPSSSGGGGHAGNSASSFSRDDYRSMLSTMRLAAREAEEAFDNRSGYERFEEGSSRIGYLFNMLPCTITSEDRNERSALDLYFLQQDGHTFKATVSYEPYFYVILASHNSEREVIATLERKYEGLISSITPVEMDDLEMKNHLAGHKRRLLKLRFRSVNELMKVRNQLKPIVDKSSILLARGENLEEEAVSSGDVLHVICDMREHDVPYYTRVSIDKQIRVGAWYTVTPNGFHTEMHLRGCCEVQRLPESFEGIPEPRILAWDIECTKAPLKFPDANVDQVYMISYMLDGEGYLLINREIVSEDVPSFEYTPTDEFKGPFTVTNCANEEAMLRTFIDHCKLIRPQIYVTYNGDFFDWPFVHIRCSKYGINIKTELGMYSSLEGSGKPVSVGSDQEWRGRTAAHMDCLYWVKRDSYLPQGSQGLKNVTKEKLGYDPVEIDPEDMLAMARDNPSHMASYSVSDAVATYYLYMKYVHAFVFSLCTIIPMGPDDVLRKGSGTLCEMLLMVEAFNKAIICPNKQKDALGRTHNGHLLETETYLGGHVECLESGVFRSDIPITWRLVPSAFDELIAKIDKALTFAIEVESGEQRSDIVDYEDVRAKIIEGLELLRDKPIREEKPVIYHLDVAAMYPNIILSNRLQPCAMVTEETCAGCDYDTQVDARCKRHMQWMWRGEYYPATGEEVESIRAQLQYEVIDNVPYTDLPPPEQVSLLKARLKKYCAMAYKRVKDTEEREREATVCQRENPFYVDTVRAFRDRRYDYKIKTKKANKELAAAEKSGNQQDIFVAKQRVVLYDSLQLAHKCILNSFYGYVMRKGARWHSMEMAGVVTFTGSNLIQQARQLVEQIGRPLELDTDGIWCVLPASFPQKFSFTKRGGGKIEIMYPCVMLNADVHERYTNHQYQELVDPVAKTYKIRSECSIFFELDGPYAAMVLPASPEEGRLLKKRYAVFELDGTLAELKGFELKRRGELKMIKVFQQQVFDHFLDGDSLEACYNAVGSIADWWLNILDGHGADLSDEEIVDYLSENRSMSKTVDEYGDQKSVAISTARRLAEFLGAETVKDRGLACKLVVVKKPAGSPVTDRAVPTTIFSADPKIRRFYLRKWCRDNSMTDEEMDIRSLLDWDYYKTRLSGTIQKIITIPAALQRVKNPVTRVPHPEWLAREVAAHSSNYRQLSLSNFVTVNKGGNSNTNTGTTNNTSMVDTNYGTDPSSHALVHGSHTYDGSNGNVPSSSTKPIGDIEDSFRHKPLLFTSTTASSGQRGRPLVHKVRDIPTAPMVIDIMEEETNDTAMNDTTKNESLSSSSPSDANTDGLTASLSSTEPSSTEAVPSISTTVAKVPEPVIIPLLPTSTPEETLDWLSVRKASWRKTRQAKKERLLAIANMERASRRNQKGKKGSTVTTGSTDTVTKGTESTGTKKEGSVSSRSTLITTGPGHGYMQVIDIRPDPTVPGKFIMWAFTGPRKLQRLQLRMPRSVYINRRVPFPDDHPLASIAIPLPPSVPKILPHDALVNRLYELRVSERRFQTTQRLFQRAFDDDDIVGVYESQTPLLFRVLMTLGCVTQISVQRRHELLEEALQLMHPNGVPGSKNGSMIGVQNGKLLVPGMKTVTTNKVTKQSSATANAAKESSTATVKQLKLENVFQNPGMTVRSSSSDFTKNSTTSTRHVSFQDLTSIDETNERQETLTDSTDRSDGNTTTDGIIVNDDGSMTIQTPEKVPTVSLLADETLDEDTITSNTVTTDSVPILYAEGDNLVLSTGTAVSATNTSNGTYDVAVDGISSVIDDRSLTPDRTENIRSNEEPPIVIDTTTGTDQENIDTSTSIPILTSTNNVPAKVTNEPKKKKLQVLNKEILGTLRDNALAAAASKEAAARKKGTLFDYAMNDGTTGYDSGNDTVLLNSSNGGSSTTRVMHAVTDDWNFLLANHSSATGSTIGKGKLSSGYGKDTTDFTKLLTMVSNGKASFGSGSSGSSSGNNLQNILSNLRLSPTDFTILTTSSHPYLDPCPIEVQYLSDEVSNPTASPSLIVDPSRPTGSAVYRRIFLYHSSPSVTGTGSQRSITAVFVIQESSLQIAEEYAKQIIRTWQTEGHILPHMPLDPSTVGRIHSEATVAVPGVHVGIRIEAHYFIVAPSVTVTTKKSKTSSSSTPSVHVDDSDRLSRNAVLRHFSEENERLQGHNENKFEVRVDYAERQEEVWKRVSLLLQNYSPSFSARNPPFILTTCTPLPLTTLQRFLPSTTMIAPFLPSPYEANDGHFPAIGWTTHASDRALQAWYRSLPWWSQQLELARYCQLPIGNLHDLAIGFGQNQDTSNMLLSLHTNGSSSAGSSSSTVLTTLMSPHKQSRNSRGGPPNSSSTGNDSNHQEDPFTGIADLFFARMLTFNNQVLWLSTSSVPDLGGNENDSSSALTLSTTGTGMGVTVSSGPSMSTNSGSYGSGAFGDSLVNPVMITPGMYRNVCVSVNLLHLAVNTVLNSESLAALDGNDALFAAVAGSSSEESTGTNNNNSKNTGNENSSMDDSTNGTHVRSRRTATGSCIHAFRALQRLVVNWHSDLVNSGNAYAFELLQRMYAWLASPGSLLHDPALHRLVHTLMSRTFALLLRTLKQSGLTIVYGTFDKMILSTGKSTLAAAISHVRQALIKMRNNPLFKYLSLVPQTYYHSMVFVDEANFCGIGTGNDGKIAVQYGFDTMDTPLPTLSAQTRDDECIDRMVATTRAALEETGNPIPSAVWKILANDYLKNATEDTKPENRWTLADYLPGSAAKIFTAAVEAFVLRPYVARIKRQFQRMRTHFVNHVEPLMVQAFTHKSGPAVLLLSRSVSNDSMVETGTGTKNKRKRVSRHHDSDNEADEADDSVNEEARMDRDHDDRLSINDDADAGEGQLSEDDNGYDAYKEINQGLRTPHDTGATQDTTNSSSPHAVYTPTEPTQRSPYTPSSSSSGTKLDHTAVRTMIRTMNREEENHEVQQSLQFLRDLVTESNGIADKMLNAVKVLQTETLPGTASHSHHQYHHTTDNGTVTLASSSLLNSNPALEFVKATCQVLLLDNDVTKEIEQLRSMLLNYLHVRESDAVWSDPSLSYILRDVVCPACHSCRDLDLCRDRYMVKVPLTNENYGTTDDNRTNTYYDDGTPRYHYDWKCPCGHTYNRIVLEESLVATINYRSMMYQNQDMKCTKCKRVRAATVRKVCECSGNYTLVESRTSFVNLIKVFKALAETFHFSSLTEAVHVLTMGPE